MTHFNLKNDADLIHASIVVSTALTELKKSQKEQKKLLDKTVKELSRIEQKNDAKSIQLKRALKVKITRMDSKLSETNKTIDTAERMLSALDDCGG